MYRRALYTCFADDAKVTQLCGKLCSCPAAVWFALGCKLLTGHARLHVPCAMILPEAAEHELTEDAIHAVNWHGLGQTVFPSKLV